MGAAMKHMASNFAKLDKFEGVDFKRWQQKMHFLLSSMSVVYVLTTPMPEDGGDNPTVEQVRKRAKWDNDDYVCRGLILNGMSDSLFDIYKNIETSKELWDTLEAKYMAEDASSKKFLVSNFTNYKMTDSRLVLEQYIELFGIIGRFTQHKINMDESIQGGLTLVELGSHLRIEESLRAQDNDKPKGNNVVGPSVVSMVKHNNSSRYNDNRGKRKHHDTKGNGSGTKGLVDGSFNTLKVQNIFNKSLQVYYVTYVSETYFVQDDDVAWWVDSGATMHVCKDRCWFKIYESLNDRSILHMGNKSTALVHCGCLDLRAVVKLPDPKLKTLGERGIKCIFVGYAEHSKAFRFYVIKPNDSNAINSIIESRAAIFDENKFSSIPRPSQRSLVKGTEDTGGAVVPEKVIEEVVQQPEPELRKSKRHRTPKDFGPKFQLYLIEGTRDEVPDQYSYCFNVEDDSKTFNKAMKSQDVAF
ncbi:hypothetical protein Tco_0935428 [Tanacetum coccineum]